MSLKVVKNFGLSSVNKIVHIGRIFISDQETLCEKEEEELISSLKVGLA